MEVTGATRLYRAAAVWTAGLGCGFADGRKQPKVGAGETALNMTNALPLELVRLIQLERSCLFDGCAFGGNVR